MKENEVVDPNVSKMSKKIKLFHSHLLIRFITQVKPHHESLTEIFGEILENNKI